MLQQLTCATFILTVQLIRLPSSVKPLLTLSSTFRTCFSAEMMIRGTCGLVLLHVFCCVLAVHYDHPVPQPLQSAGLPSFSVTDQQNSLGNTVRASSTATASDSEVFAEAVMQSVDNFGQEARQRSQC